MAYWIVMICVGWCCNGTNAVAATVQTCEIKVMTGADMLTVVLVVVF